MTKDKNVLLKKANLILYEAGLQSSDMKLWGDKLKNNAVDTISLFIDTFENDKELLKMATSNLNKKVEAIGDPKKIQSLIKEEKETLEKYLNE